MSPRPAARPVRASNGRVPYQRDDVVRVEIPVDETAEQRDERHAAARARRAARKAARAAAPVPGRDRVYDHLSIADLRTLRRHLGEEETRVSYWRRILQARLDLVQSELPGGAPVADLTRVLADAARSRTRMAALSTLPHDELPPLPDLAEVWARDVARDDEPGRTRLVADLRHAEEQLSRYRTHLHRCIDHVTAELIARYREDPALALGALPGDPLRRTGRAR